MEEEQTDKLIMKKICFFTFSFLLITIIYAQPKPGDIDSLKFKVPDLMKRMNEYPAQIKDSKLVLNNMIAAYCAKLNVQSSYYNWISYNHKLEQRETLILDELHLVLGKNPISNFYNNFAQSFTVSPDPNSFENQLIHLNEAIEIIEPLYKKNKLLHDARFLVLMAKGREISSFGYFLEAHEILSKIKADADKLNIHNKTVFYVNYITNLVKCKFYKEALHTLENEFTIENSLYKNMLLYNRLLCYLFLRDTKNLATYITYDLDAAPFPQSYVLKMIKSAYFYLIGEYETALSIINSLLQAKSSSDNMQYYQPIATIFKKLYTISQKNSLQKKWSEKDIKIVQDGIIEFEETAPAEFKLVSTYLWIKDEIELNLKKKNNQ